METDLVAGDDGDALDDDVVALALLGQDDGGREEAGDEGETHLEVFQKLIISANFIILNILYFDIYLRTANQNTREHDFSRNSF